MVDESFNFLLKSLICCIFLLTSLNGHCVDDLADRQTKVGMRMIGHEILLKAGDETSRVLPIVKEEDRFKIQFSSPFGFDPAVIVKTITEVVEKTDMAREYLVEVESCASKEVVYSYKMGSTSTTDLVACSGRIVPKACYVLYMTILSSSAMELAQMTNSRTSSSGSSWLTLDSSNRNLFALLMLSLLILGGLALYSLSKRNEASIDPDLLTIGDYRFNKRNMTLSHNDESIELTSKEADLLLLLYKSSNKTLERENILNVVWGDDGDYTGRTLDVFISKLRKKLNADNSLKIINIRGVGYRFVVNQ